MNVTTYLIEERARARVGSTLQREYKLERLLGIGGMAAVYEAIHRNGKRFAVKVLHPELSRQAETRRRFLREGYVASVVAHPGAVAVIDDDVAEDGSAFLVMELLIGASLDRVCESHGGTLPSSTVLAVAERLLDVLAAADARAIVHRDIKPANLFLTREGELKVLDFGVARLRERGGGRSTQSGTTLGTPAFMAPEQALGQVDEVSGQTDVWAAGATMFALLSGRAVHCAGSAPEQMALAATKPAQPLAEVAPAIASSVCAIVDRALAFAPADRWPTAASMRDAVREAHRALFPDESIESALAALTAGVPSERSLPAPGGPSGPTALAGPQSQKAPSFDGRRSSVRRAAVIATLVVVGIGVSLVVMRAERGTTAPTHASATAGAVGAIGDADGLASASTAAATSAGVIAVASAAAPESRPSAAASVSRPAVPQTLPPAAPTTTARDNFDRQ